MCSSVNLSSSRVIIFSDFDGTISIGDAHYQILQQFADPSWIEIENRYLAGQIGSQTAIQQEFKKCQVMKNELDHFIKTHIVLDESFTGFYHKLAALQIPFTIVSDGFDYIIHRILLLNNIQPPPIYANHLDWAPNQSLSTAKISFPCQRKSSHQYNPGRNKNWTTQNWQSQNRNQWSGYRHQCRHLYYSAPKWSERNPCFPS